jgi:ATP-dependent metalloprotease FtsH
VPPAFSSHPHSPPFSPILPPPSPLCRDPERARTLKAAQAALKGVKLQYTDAAEAVFFEDVAGIGDAKVELQEVVDFFRKPERFRASGSRIPRGVLLCGPPGTGKTLLARAVAGEAGVGFLSLNASEVVEMFVGVGASRVRDLFATARAMAPAIIFIDEIDSVGRLRGGAQGNDERDQTLNQMLSEMDGFDSGASVIVMAATNRKDILDPALVRPGRFDRSVLVPLPDYQGRIEILRVHLGRRPHDPGMDLHEVAFETRQYSGAQLANLVNIAATVAAAAGREEIVGGDLVRALEEERLGPARAPYGEPARRRLAVMEGATALACTLLPAIEPVAVVTIAPREKHPLGQTVVTANEGRELTQVFTRRYLEEQLVTVLAGRAAEEAVYGADGMSTIQQRRLVLARRIAAKLVVSAAMAGGEALGPRTLSSPRV